MRAGYSIDLDSNQKLLRAEQRGWVKGRNDRWKSDDQRGCVKLHTRPE
jgi:hypothetical protein